MSTSCNPQHTQLTEYRDGQMPLLSLALPTQTTNATANNLLVLTGALLVTGLSPHMEAFHSKDSHVRVLSVVDQSVTF